MRIVKALGLIEEGVSVKMGIAGTCAGTTTLCFALPGNGRYSASVDADVLDDFPEHLTLSWDWTL